MNAVIIDDELHARKNILNLLTLYNAPVEVIAEAGCVEEAFSIINQHKPELVFLDINMPDGSGFDLLKKFDNIFFKIIFVTAYEEHAIKAFKYSALDYILKPIDPEDLLTAIDKAIKSNKIEDTNLELKTFFTNEVNKQKEKKKIVLKTADAIYPINITDIIRIEGEGNYSTFFLTDKRKLIVSKNLKEFEDILLEFKYFRPHQSHLINFDYIQSFEKNSGYINMVDNSRIPVSTRKKDDILKILDNL